MSKYPPGINPSTVELIETGRWDIETTDWGWIVKTEGYSWCCNPEGQSVFHLDKEGNVFKTEHGIGKPKG